MILTFSLPIILHQTFAFVGRAFEEQPYFSISQAWRCLRSTARVSCFLLFYQYTH